MHSIKTPSRTLEGYEAVIADGRRDGDVRPLFHDAARVVLSDSKASFAIGFRRSKNPLGKEIKIAEVANLATGETFALTVDTVFLAVVVGGDPKIMVKSGEEIVCYADFGKTEHKIEPDGDKAELTPLGYYDAFVRYDDDYYYPLMFDPAMAAKADVRRFHDYYGFRAYTDRGGNRHFVLCYEDETSTDERWVWHYCDNFKRCSERIDFGDESEIETWDVDADGRIRMLTTENKKFHVDASGKVRPGWPDSSVGPVEFAYERFFEDTDSDIVIGRTDKGLFPVDRNKSVFSDSEINAIKYYSKLVAVRKNAEYPVFMFADSDGVVSVVDSAWKILTGTDLDAAAKVVSFSIDRGDGEVTVGIEGGETRRYAI